MLQPNQKPESTCSELEKKNPPKTNQSSFKKLIDAKNKFEFIHDFLTQISQFPMSKCTFLHLWLILQQVKYFFWGHILNNYCFLSKQSLVYSNLSETIFVQVWEQQVAFIHIFVPA